MTSLIEKIEAVDTGKYELCAGAMTEILNFSRKSASGALYTSMVLGYQYGFMRGQNAEKARRRKAKK